MTQINYTFDKRTQRYHRNDNKRFVGISELRQLVNQSIAQKQAIAQNITQDLFEGKIKVSEWEEKVSSLLKTSTIQLYKLGKPELTQRDYGIIGSRYLKPQYSRLRKFSYDILSGSQSEAQIKNRVNMYFLKMRESFEDGRRESHIEARINWERRKTNSKEPCISCPVWAAMGWQRPGVLPRPTERCECRSRCRCSLEFSWSRMKPTESLVLQSAFGWL